MDSPCIFKLPNSEDPPCADTSVFWRDTKKKALPHYCSFLFEACDTTASALTSMRTVMLQHGMTFLKDCFKLIQGISTENKLYVLWTFQFLLCCLHISESAGG